MFINITDSAMAGNKGSSRALVHYLEKENRVDDKLEPELWFNHNGNRIEAYEVRTTIDGNIARLCKTDAKFFLVNISPSQKELKFLKERFGKKEMKQQLKWYAEKVMDEYARNFRREGIGSAKDLVWFGKIEHHRYHGHRDTEVLNGERKRDERKEGNQMHIQVIVSRKDSTNKIKLSPMNNSRGRNESHSRKLGQFNRVAFKQSGEVVFDEMFGFQRGLKETMAYANVRKNGNISQREQMSVLGLAEFPGRHKEVVNDLARGVENERFPLVQDMLEAAGKSVSGFVEMMMEQAEYTPETNPVEKAEKRRRKQRDRDQGLGL